MDSYALRFGGACDDSALCPSLLMHKLGLLSLNVFCLCLCSCLLVHSVVPHFQSGLFDSLTNVTFDRVDKTRMTEMFSQQTERVRSADCFLFEEQSQPRAVGRMCTKKGKMQAAGSSLCAQALSSCALYFRASHSCNVCVRLQRLVDGLQVKARLCASTMLPVFVGGCRPQYIVTCKPVGARQLPGPRTSVSDVRLIVSSTFVLPLTNGMFSGVVLIICHQMRALIAQDTVKQNIKRAVRNVLEMNLEEFIFGNPAQVR
eukprot:1158208-Pelagomonas_calceolata.AAC.31